MSVCSCLLMSSRAVSLSVHSGGEGIMAIYLSGSYLAAGDTASSELRQIREWCL